MAFDVKIDLDLRPGAAVVNSLWEAQLASQAADQMGLLFDMTSRRVWLLRTLENI